MGAALPCSHYYETLWYISTVVMPEFQKDGTTGSAIHTPHPTPPQPPTPVTQRNLLFLDFWIMHFCHMISHILINFKCFVTYFTILWCFKGFSLKLLVFALLLNCSCFSSWNCTHHNEICPYCNFPGMLLGALAVQLMKKTVYYIIHIYGLHVWYPCASEEWFLFSCNIHMFHTCVVFSMLQISCSYFL